MTRSLTVAMLITFAVTNLTTGYAADLPKRPNVYKAVPGQPTYDWSGFYAGVNVGYDWGRSRWSDPGVGANSGRLGTSGGLVGGQLGYNWQIGAAVLGI